MPRPQPVGYPSRVASLFRRKPGEVIESAEPVAEPIEPVAPRSYTPKKGEATPKRPPAGRRGGVQPPADRKEATARMRDRQRTERNEARAGRLAGDERYLLGRDKGPVRALVRDVVDSRRNAGELWFAATFLVLIVSLLRSPLIQTYGLTLWAILAVATIVDSFLITRRIKRAVTEQFPDSEEPWGRLYRYAIMRSLSFRFMRMPKPRVKPGTKI